MKNVLKILSSLLFFTLTFHSQAQKFPNSIYGEFLGNGAYYSLNYSRQVLAKDNFFVSPSIGISTIGRKHSSIPVLINVYYGGPNHSIESGIGYTGAYREEKLIRMYSEFDHTYFQHYITARLGYRYESENGFLFKVAFTPLYLVYSGYLRDYDYTPMVDEPSDFRPFFGISFGKSF